MKNPFIALLILALFATPVSVFAQTDGTVDDLLATIRDDTMDRAVRAQAVGRLLATGQGRGHEELGKLLASTETSDDLRFLIASGALFTEDLPLLDGVIALAIGDDDLGEKVRERFRASPDGEVVKALSRRIDDASVDPERKLALIRLLGYTGRRAALERLVVLWESDDSAVSEAAAAAFHRILPKELSGAAAARKFLEANQELSVAELAKIHAPENGAAKPDPAVPHLIDLARVMAVGATWQQLLDSYLGDEVLAEIRKIGAETLAKYGWDEREKAGADEARAKAAGVVLDVLDMETDDEVVVALLGTAQSLTESLLATQPERVNHLVTKRLASPNRVVRLMAIDTLGKLGDQRAIPDLQKQYTAAGEADADYRLAVLNALEIIRNTQGLDNGGMSKWLLAMLSSEKLEAVVIRLIRILGGYTELPEAVPPLAKLLRSSENGTIRRLAADRLGLLGARPGEAEALDALAEAGLEDEDPSVREVSATSLGRAPKEKVRAGILERLAKRLGEAETEAKVRTAAAGSLLRLQGVRALPKLIPLVADDDIWDQAVLAWLSSDVLAVEATAEQTVAAAALVRALRKASAWERCRDAANRILDADTLVWEGAAAVRRRAIVLDRAWAAAETEKPADVLAMIPVEVVPEEVTDLDSLELLLLRSRLQRQTGQAAEAAKVLTTLLDYAPSIEGAEVEAVQLELAECHLLAEDWVAATAAVASLLELEEYAERAKAIEERAKLGQRVATLIADLEKPDEAVREAAVDGLKGLGEAAYPALDRWLTAREGDPKTADAAVETIATILSKPLEYDPAASEEDRRKALDAAHAALKPGA